MSYMIKGYTFPEYIENQEMIAWVKRGAALIPDELKEKIQPDTLNMSSCIYCILGQAYGSFYTGVHKLFGFVPDPENEYWTDEQWQVLEEHGFLSSLDYQELEVVWKAVLSQMEEGHEQITA